MSFNWDTATHEERLAEVARRDRNRLAGRAPTDDGEVVVTKHQAVGKSDLASVERTLAEIERSRPSARHRLPSGDFTGASATGTLEPVPHSRSEAKRIATQAQRGGKVAGITMVTLELPWSHLIGDNERFAPAIRIVRGNPRAVLVMTAAYRTAKKRAVHELQRQFAAGAIDWPPISRPVRVTACLVEPDRRTRRDVGNYVKAVHDCLTNAQVIADDSLINELRWSRAGVDIDRPRLELYVEVIG